MEKIGELQSEISFIPKDERPAVEDSKNKRSNVPPTFRMEKPDQKPEPQAFYEEIAGMEKAIKKTEERIEEYRAEGMKGDDGFIELRTHLEKLKGSLKNTNERLQKRMKELAEKELQLSR